MSTWTAPERAETPRTPDERTSLDSWLEFHRATLLIDDLDPARADQDLAAYMASVDRSHAAIAGRGLDDLVPDSSNPISLRWIYQHMIEEYARHNGHADLIRQAIDGQTGS
jgi:hypothetical protein